MKKLTSIILTIGIILTLSACSDNTSSSMTDSGSSSDVSSAISSEASSESEAELTFDEKFRGLDIDLRYDEVVELLGEPDEMGGVNVRYLSYKLDDNKTAIVQFLYGDNPRIDYTYITDSATKEEEFILHRRICDHENGVCSHNLYFTEENREYIEKLKTITYDMTMEQVVELLGEPDYDYASPAGTGTGPLVYSLNDGAHSAWVDVSVRPDDKGVIEVSFGGGGVGEREVLLHPNYCKHDEGVCYVEKYEETVKLTREQQVYEQSLFENKFSCLKIDYTVENIIDLIGEYDSQEVEGDITKLVYNLSEDKKAYICIYSGKENPEVWIAYTLDFKEKEMRTERVYSEDCYFKDFLPKGFSY